MPFIMPYQKEMDAHEKQFPDHGSYIITGTNKKEKLSGVFCKKCKKYVSTIKFLSSKKRRR